MMTHQMGWELGTGEFSKFHNNPVPAQAAITESTDWALIPSWGPTLLTNDLPKAPSPNTIPRKGGSRSQHELEGTHSVYSRY